MRERPNVVILNDTSSRYHHGCACVMRQMTSLLENRGMNILCRVSARTDWEADPTILGALRQADLIVVNGEGTLHHGKDAGKVLLRVATHEAAAGIPKALINTLYEDNPAEWGGYLRGFDIVSARDTVSAAELSAALGSQEVKVRCVPDLSMSTGALELGKDRDGVLFGDSVKWERRRDLAQAARRLRAKTFAPTKTLASRVWLLPCVRHLLYMVYNGVGIIRQPGLVMPQSAPAYLELLSRAEMHLTGRFHAVCLSMVTGTPFLALASNASKIERLLLDVGLGTSRLVSPESLRKISRASCVMPFNEAEKRAISDYLIRAHADAENLFDDLARLARVHLESAG